MTREQIIEAMAQAIAGTAQNWPLMSDAQRAEATNIAAAQLDAAEPLILQALAEKVRAAKAGNEFRSVVLERAAALIEEGLG